MLLYDIDLRDTGLSRDLIAHEGLKWPWQKWHPQLHAFETAARVRVGLYPTAVTAKR
jgi:holin-like protein